MEEIIKDAIYDDDTGKLLETAILRCSCGHNVELDSFTCPCDCGLDYNQSGQLLAPRECWGEETGEHWIECI